MACSRWLCAVPLWPENFYPRLCGSGHTVRADDLGSIPNRIHAGTAALVLASPDSRWYWRALAGAGLAGGYCHGVDRLLAGHCVVGIGDSCARLARGCIESPLY